MDEITAVKSVGVAGGEPLALVAIFLLLCYAVAWSVDLYLPLVESGEREACGSVAALRCGVAVAHGENLSCASRNRQKHPGAMLCLIIPQYRLISVDLPS